MEAVDVKKMLLENERRIAVMSSYYDPVTGEGSPIQRIPIKYEALGQKWECGIPVDMFEEYKEFFELLISVGSVEKLLEQTNQPVTQDHINELVKDIVELRYRYDFEFWGYTTIKITDKLTKLQIPFKLNQAQRRYLSRLEKMRKEGVPIRVILLKARQWGGSTLTQIYMAWIQLIHKTNWHSIIIAQIDDQARNIRGMYSRLGITYPASLGSITFLPYEGSQKIRMIKERGCIIGVGSAEKPDASRSYDYAMCHLSEVGFWKSTPQKSAEDLAQSIRATIPNIAYSLVVLESTAKGVGTFFHREWQSAENGISAYDPVFVPWYEIEMYQRNITDYDKFIDWMNGTGNEYAMFLWNEGATLEGINWYFYFKTTENYDDWRMQSEYPTTATEAFQSTGHRVFAPKYVQAARKYCQKPEFYGDIYAKSIKGKNAFVNIEFHPDERGLFLVWAKPDRSEHITDRYVVIVDLGGRTDDADWSVIKVIDRYWMMQGGKPEVVATWRGHIDQDLVSWKAAQIAKWYCDALLVVEYNSLDTDEESEGEHHLTVLDEVVKYYPNIYARNDPEKVKANLPIKYGFHTNRSTKPMVIDELNGALREGAYYERDLRACDEFDTYEVKPNGKYGAVDGCHDDLVMVTAIGLWICFKHLPTPRKIEKKQGQTKKRIVSEATI